MSYGFVYMLANAFMPNIVKIGCTERSPHQRADELSKPTGVPSPFYVVCYVEVAGFQEQEANFHRWLSDLRVSGNREFFHVEHKLRMVGLFMYLPSRLAFTSANVSRFLGANHDVWDVLDPWAKLQEQEPEGVTESADDGPALQLVVGGASSD